MALLVGIDENGYGPIMGPLVATAVGVEGGEWVGPEVEDSKRIFRGGGRGKGEEMALLLLQSVGLRPKDFHSLLDGLLVGGIRGLEELCPSDFRFCFGMLPLPVWCRGLDGATSGMGGISVKFVKLTLACPRRFNLLLGKLGSKALVDLFLFSELWEALPEGRWEVICGKVGSMSRYAEALRVVGWEVLGVLGEGPEESAYLVSRGRRRLLLKFVKDADERILPVALASILGKYVRELSMQSICNSLREALGEGVGFASGYRDDRTASLLERLLPSLPKVGLPLECLIRRR